MELQPLAGRTVAVPETRELEVFAAMLERRGASVLRCPLVAIRDAPDPAPVLAFARALTQRSFDDLILTTGEGLRRILGCIERHEPALRLKTPNGHTIELTPGESDAALIESLHGLLLPGGGSREIGRSRKTGRNTASIHGGSISENSLFRRRFPECCRSTCRRIRCWPSATRSQISSTPISCRRRSAG